MDQDVLDNVLTKRQMHKKGLVLAKADELHLTDKQRRFCEYYVASDVEDVEKTLDYGGYSYKNRQSARSIYWQITHQDKVKSFIHYLQTEVYPTLPPTATYQELLEFWSDIMRNETVDPNQRLKASERLYKHLQDDKDTTNLQNEYKDVSRMSDDDLVSATSEMLKRLEKLGLSNKVLEKLQDSTD